MPHLSPRLYLRAVLPGVGTRLLQALPAAREQSAHSTDKAHDSGLQREARPAPVSDASACPPPTRGSAPRGTATTTGTTAHKVTLSFKSTDIALSRARITLLSLSAMHRATAFTSPPPLFHSQPCLPWLPTCQPFCLNRDWI